MIGPLQVQDFDSQGGMVGKVSTLSKRACSVKKKVDGRGHMGGYERTIFVLITAHTFGFFNLVREFMGVDHGNSWTGALTPTILDSV